MQCPNCSAEAVVTERVNLFGDKIKQIHCSTCGSVYTLVDELHYTPVIQGNDHKNN